MEEQVSLRNHFLIAMPSLQDPNFFHSVAFICEHTDEGAMGIIFNHPLSISLRDVLLHMDIDNFDPSMGEIPIFSGGPVQRDRGFVIHEASYEQWQSSMNVSNDIMVTTSRDILEAIAVNQGPKNAIISLGYAGWQPGQLEQELADNSWLSIPADKHILFEVPFEDQWRAAAGLLGIDISQMSHLVGHS